ncbi:MAG: hypothetical protein Q9219_004718 [cf. Caloplaca sp. 3 TL-2023]
MRCSVGTPDCPHHNDEGPRRLPNVRDHSLEQRCDGGEGDHGFSSDKGTDLAQIATAKLEDGRTVYSSELKANANGTSDMSPVRSRHRELDTTDAKQRYQLEKDGNPPPNPKKGSKTIISFPRGDPENPYNWSSRRKIFVLFVGVVSVLNSTLGSSLPSGAIDYLAEYFHVTSQAQLVLPISLFLVGYVFGPIVFAPLSETYGRRIVMVATFVFFTIFTMACAVAPNWPFFLVFRLLCGITASSAIAVVGGLFADIYDDPITRGRAMAFFMAVREFGGPPV